MKYETNTKRDRNFAIITFRKNNPQFSLAEIGKMFPTNGKPLSAQRVHQIIKRAANNNSKK